MIETFLAWFGASDQVIGKMGPTATVMLALLAGGAFAQWVKFPLVSVIQGDAAFSWTIRTIASIATILAAHVLSDTLAWQVEVVAGLLQPLAYHLSLALIRSRWPWLEARKGVGAVCPPLEAFTAAAQRRADQAGENSGI